MRAPIVGFTGTQKGLQPSQALALEMLLESLSPMKEFHHGDCIGADEQADDRANFAGVRRVYAHPGDNPEKRANCAADFVLPPKAMRERNQDIVDACEILVACPRGPEKSLPFSGTWMTVRMARKAGKPIVLIWPDGRLEREGPAPSRDGLLALAEKRVQQALPTKEGV